MRYFNTHGPVDPTIHYHVPRTALMDDLVAQVRQGAYVTIFAPRQMGKTTVLRQLWQMLDEDSDYLPLSLSFEAFEEWAIDDFIAGFSGDLLKQVEVQLNSDGESVPPELQSMRKKPSPKTYPALRNLFSSLHQWIPQKRLVLVIDEIDGTPQEAISNLLQIWREIHLEGPSTRSIHSIVLIGLQNIARLNLGRSSPFNIAKQLRIPNFTLNQVTVLLEQYAAESGQAFEPEAVNELFHQTNGHPFLVNRLATIVSEEIVVDQSQPIHKVNIEAAVEKIKRETNYNFEALLQRAGEYKEDVLNILFGASEEFNLNDPMIGALYAHGVVKEKLDGGCEIANPIYASVLLAGFRPRQSGLQGQILLNGYDLRPHTVDGELQMTMILSRFREFVERRGREAFKVTPMPQEATGQYLLMAYLHLVVRQLGGDLFTEVDSGEGRLDLIVVHKGKRYIVETKIWRGPAYFEEGLEQLRTYLAKEGASEGYYVVFHARPQVYGKLAKDELEYVDTNDGARVHVYLPRIGDIFGEEI